MPSQTSLNTLAAAALATLALAGCGSSNTTSTQNNAQTSQPTTATPTTATTTTSPATPTTTTPTATPPTPTNQPTTQTPNTPKQHRLPRVEKITLTSPALNSANVLAPRYTCDGTNTSPPIRWSGIPAGTSELQLDILNLTPVNGTLYFDWAIAGINPTLHEIPAGKLPPATITGTNSNGQTKYSLCPPNGKAEAYVAVLFALPHHTNPKPGYNAFTQRLKTLHEAPYEALLSFTYGKK